MSAKEVEERKKVSKNTGKGSNWDKWPEEMWKKTAIRALYKLLPRSSEMSMAFLQDTRSETGEKQTPITLNVVSNTPAEPPQRGWDAPKASEPTDAPEPAEEAAPVDSTQSEEPIPGWEEEAAKAGSSPAKGLPGVE